MPCPGGGEFVVDSIGDLKQDGVDVVVCLLEDDEIDRLDMRGEEAACLQCGVEFLRHPMPDHALPYDDKAAADFARAIYERFVAGQSIAIHCFAGIGRATMIAATVLIISGLSAGEAVERISAARGLSVPDTRRQLEWIEEAERYLRGG